MKRLLIVLLLLALCVPAHAGNIGGGGGTLGDTVESAEITDGTIVNDDVNASAAIAATKIHDGSVDNTEFGYLNGVSSAIQTQIAGKMTGGWKVGAGALASSNQASAGVYASSIVKVDTALTITTALLAPSFYDPASAVTTKLQREGSPSITCSEFDSNLVAFWKLSDTSFADSTANNNDLVGNDTPTIATGYYGNGADFESGDGNYLSLADAAQNGLDLGMSGASFSVAQWIKLESGDAVRSVTRKKDEPNNGWCVYTNADEKVVFALRSDSGSTYLDLISNTTLSTGTWYHIVCVFDNTGNTARIYINGNATPDATATYSSNIPNNAQPFIIGAFGAGSNHFDGIIDEVAVFNKALSTAEIAAIYANGIESIFGFADIATLTPGSDMTFTGVSPGGVRVKITGSASLDVRGFTLMMK